MRQRLVGHWLQPLSVGFCALAFLFSEVRAFAQTEPGGPLTLGDAIQLALKNYPAIKESRARAQAAAEGVGVAQTAFWPRLDVFGQLNRATTNNVFGLLLPQSVVPSISGPVLGARSLSDNVWGTAAG